MKKAHNQELDFLYINQEEKEKKKKKEKKSKEKKDNEKAKKKEKKKRKEKREKNDYENEQLFNFDNEIVIGIKKIPPEKEEKAKKKNKKKKKSKTNTNQNINKKKTVNQIKKEKGKKRLISFTKCIVTITIISAVLIFLFLSPLFNVMEIQVEDNHRITKDDIIKTSNIHIGDNAFRINASAVKKNIMENPYVEDVQIKRLLPSIIKIVIKERTPTYALILAEENSYAFINNQGYILEIGNTNMGLPIISSYSSNDITPGARLNNEDLLKLGSVLKIMETANANQIGNLISGIDIKDDKGFIIYMESEKKTIYIGEPTYLSTKMLYIKANLEDEKGIEGELFMDDKTNKAGEYLFREKV